MRVCMKTSTKAVGLGPICPDRDSEPSADRTELPGTQANDDSAQRRVFRWISGSCGRPVEDADLIGALAADDVVFP